MRFLTSPASESFPRMVIERSKSWIFVVVLLVSVASGAGADAALSSSELITNITGIWNIPQHLRSNANPVKLTGTVNIYDPEWRLLWIQDGTSGLFCAPKPPFPELKPGQQIELSAFTKPGSRDLSLANAQYRVLSETGLPAPWIITLPLPPARLPDNIRAQLEGYVRGVTWEDKSHLRFEVVAGDSLVRVTVQTTDRSQRSVPEDSFVRVKGVFAPKFDRSKKLIDAQMFVPQLEEIEVLHTMASNTQFAIPARAIASLHTAPNQELVRVQGTVKQQEPGTSVVVQDGTGDVTVETWQTRTVKPGEWVEAIGFVVVDGPKLRLRQGMFRSNSDREAMTARLAESGLQEWNLIDQVRQLPPEETARGYPVKITGVVTWADRGTGKMYLHDSSGGLGVLYDPTSLSHEPHVGDWLDVRGITGDGGYSPVIQNPILSGRGTLKMPTARLVSLEQAMTGVEDSQWIEMRGYVRSVTNAPGLAQLEVATSSGSFMAVMRTTSRLEGLPGAIVRLRGVCAALHNDRRQLTGVQLWVPSAEEITVEEEAPKNPFSVPLRTIASLGQFSTSATLNRRAKISGVVTLNAGHYLYVQDGMDGLLVLTEQSNDLERGDRVEAVGFPGQDGRHPVLRDAVFQKTSRDAEPAPLEIDPAQPLDANWEGRLVAIEGVVLQQSRTATGRRLTLREKGTIFEAKFDSAAPLKELANGSRVALTGVYRVHYSESKSSDYLQLHLRSPADVQILRRPSWWTLQRTIFALALVSVLLLAGTAWTVMMSRKNTLLREQIRERQHAEAALQTAHGELEQRVGDRTAELSQTNEKLRSEITERQRAEAKVERTTKQLLETSRQAGMAEVATSVLHNVGNVLNSVNVSTTLVAEQIRNSKIANLAKVVALMDEHAAELGAFITDDPKGKLLPGYLKQLTSHLATEQNLLLKEMDQFRHNIEHIKDIVAMQQSYAKVSGVTETLQIADLVEDALRMNAGALTRHEVEVVREFAEVPPVTIDKHKVLQVLVNLIRNAKYACDESGRTDKRMTVRVANGEGRIKIAIIDNGVGIPAENLIRIFNHGFTTRKEGHGFGLHSGALAARELGGSLHVHSEGAGRGAMFTLELPMERESSVKLNAS